MWLVIDEWRWTNRWQLPFVRFLPLAGDVCAVAELGAKGRVLRREVQLPHPVHAQRPLPHSLQGRTTKLAHSWIDFKSLETDLVNFVLGNWLCPLSQGKLAQSTHDKSSPNLSPAPPSSLIRSKRFPFLYIGEMQTLTHKAEHVNRQYEGPSQINIHVGGQNVLPTRIYTLPQSWQKPVFPCNFSLKLSKLDFSITHNVLTAYGDLLICFGVKYGIQLHNFRLLAYCLPSVCTLVLYFVWPGNICNSW